jgi:hypothetical protein
LTDPVAIAVFAAKSNRDYDLNDVYLCLELDRTLGERQRCHKRVAGGYQESAIMKRMLEN